MSKLLLGYFIYIPTGDQKLDYNCKVYVYYSYIVALVHLEVTKTNAF